MKKNLSYRLNSKNVATTKNDEYTALMLYDIAQKLIVFLEVFLPQYHKFLKINKIHFSKSYSLMNKTTKDLCKTLCRAGVLEVAKSPFRSFYNALYSHMTYDSKKALSKLSENLQKFSCFKTILEASLCNEDFFFDFETLSKYDLKLQTGEVDLSLIAKGDFEALEKQLEGTFKTIENRYELKEFLSQFFNFEEDIDDCSRFAS